MNIPRIANAIGYLDDGLISAANEYSPKNKKRRKVSKLVRWIPLAACFCVLIGVGIYAGTLIYAAGDVTPLLPPPGTVTEKQAGFTGTVTETENNAIIIECAAISGEVNVSIGDRVRVFLSNSPENQVSIPHAGEEVEIVFTSDGIYPDGIRCIMLLDEDGKMITN